MIECVDAGAHRVWRIAGAMTQLQAAGLLLAGQGLLATNGATPIQLDLSAVDKTDSSALAVLLDWLRTARRQGAAVSLQGSPQGLRALAELYGLQELLNFV